MNRLRTNTSSSKPRTLEQGTWWQRRFKETSETNYRRDESDFNLGGDIGKESIPSFTKWSQIGDHKLKI